VAKGHLKEMKLKPAASIKINKNGIKQFPNDELNKDFIALY